MTDQQLYDLSTELGQIVQGARRLMGLQTLRYHHFVQGSDRGFECTYARLTSRRYHDQEGPEPTREALLSIRKHLDRALEELPASAATDSPPRWLENLRLEHDYTPSSQ